MRSGRLQRQLQGMMAADSEAEVPERKAKAKTASKKKTAAR